MIGRSHRHLPEERLVGSYVAEQCGEALDPPVSDHLADCAECSHRYQDLCRFMDGLRALADDEISDLFPDDALLAQRAQIVRRLEHAGHAAKVLSFPARLPDQPVNTQGHHAPRWVAAAAAAGLFIGLALGTITGVGGRLLPGQAASSQPVSAPAVVVSVPSGSDAAGGTLDEDAFLRELELARGGLRARALTPLDTFTPSVREVSAQVR